MKLYSGPLSMFGAKAEIAALEKGLDVELIMVPFEMKTLCQPKHPEVLRINPKRQGPVLIDEDLELFDSTQIFEYFESVKPEPPLWPAEPKARARARLLEHKSDEIYFPPVVRLMGLQTTPDDPAAVEARAAHLPKGWTKEYFGWPGLGDQPHDPAITSFDDLIRLVDAKIDGPVDLVAQSMGGVIAANIALARPDVVRRLVLTVTSGGVDMASFGAGDWRPAYRKLFPRAAEWGTAP